MGRPVRRGTRRARGLHRDVVDLRCQDALKVILGADRGAWHAGVLAVLAKRAIVIAAKKKTRAVRLGSIHPCGVEETFFDAPVRRMRSV